MNSVENLVRRIKLILGPGDTHTINALARSYAERIQKMNWDVNGGKLNLALNILEKVDKIAAAQGLVRIQGNVNGFQNAKIF